MTRSPNVRVIRTGPGGRMLAMTLTAGLMAMGGCAAQGQPVTKSEPASQTSQTRFPAVHEDWSRMGYRMDWVGFPFVDAAPRGVLRDAAAFDDVFVIQDRQSTVSVLEAATGKVRWSVDLAGPLTKFVAITRDATNPDQIMVCSESEAFTLSLASSNLVGRERFERVVNTRPVMAGGLGIFGTSTGEVYAHQFGQGTTAWAFRMNGAIEADPILIGDTIGVVSIGEDVCFFSLGGSLLGRARLFGAVATNPVTDGRSLLIAGLDQSVWSFDPSGLRLWRYRTSSPLRTQPTAHDGVLYVNVPGTGLVALDPTTGQQKWACKDLSDARVIGVRAGRLLAWTGRGLATVDPATGDLVDRIQTPGIMNVYADRFVDGNLYGVSERGVVGKFIPR